MDLRKIAARIADTLKEKGNFLNGMTKDQLDEACQKAYDAWVDLSDKVFTDEEELKRADEEAGELIKSVLHLLEAGAEVPSGLDVRTLPIMRDMVGMQTEEDIAEREKNLRELEDFLEDGGEFPDDITGAPGRGGIQATCLAIACRVAAF